MLLDFSIGVIMKAVIQRVESASVEVNKKIIGNIDKGYMILVCAEKDDGEEDIRYISNKIVNLRIFPDDKGRFHFSVKDIGGEILLISQFTLAADVNSGRRPSFSGAAEPEKALKLCQTLSKTIKAEGLKVQEGEFGAWMKVSLINDGPVTINLDSNKKN